MSDEKLEDFNDEIANLVAKIKAGTKPTLRDLLLYQRVLNYNVVTMYKSMVHLMVDLSEIQKSVEKIEKSQEDVFLQIQTFLDAHKLLKNIDDPQQDD